MSSKNLKSAMAPRSAVAKPVAETFIAPPEEPAQATKVLTVRIPPELHRQARLYAAQHDITMNGVATEGLEMRMGMDPDTYQRAGLYAAQQGMSLGQLIVEALELRMNQD